MYEIRFPTEALRPYIENYWLVRPDAGPVDLSVNVFVDARADLIFNFGAPYQRERLGGATREIRHSNLDAQRLTPIRITQRGDVRVSGVRFRLGGLGAFVAPLRAWTDETPTPHEVFGADAARLEQALQEPFDLDAHTALYDAFFTERLSADGTYATFTRALDALVADPSLSVDALARAVDVSPRHVERLFARHLGIAPKTLARVVRFQNALRRLMKDPGVPLATVAAETGYFDQAHFVRDFKRMSGGVPRGYRGYYPPDGPSDFAPNVVVFVQDDPEA
ncbi:MAG: AraC family transcriptional regulator [Sandaracinus sp.]|nr:AraC family transcriptional regulator [Sandaracinus sp.]MCB9631043.1 AraC family transcriptional regulator [Sandaracinus sp.]